MIHTINYDYKTFRPRKGYLLVKVTPNDGEVKTESGIVTEITRSTLDRPCFGQVVMSVEDNIEIGDVVVYPNTDGIDCEFNGQKNFVLLKASSVIGTVG